MRLIDADALIERLDDFNKWCKDERLQGSLFAVDVVGDMPTVDVLDKIRDEIEQKAWEIAISDTNRANGMWDAYRIINKYTKD